MIERPVIDPSQWPDLGGDWEVGDDEAHEGRFSATLRWDDPIQRIHHSITAVNEPTPQEAVRSVVEEYQHGLDHPELHWPWK